MKTEHVLMRILGLKLSIEEHQGSVDRYGVAHTSAKDKETAVEMEVIDLKKKIARSDKDFSENRNAI